MQSPEIEIAGRRIGSGHPVYIIAEISANHNQDFDEAARLVRAAKDVGADAVKLQTYTPDTMTLDSDRAEFMIGPGTLWEGKNLYALYGEAYTPWEWQPRLKALADDLGLHLFSSPFDLTAVEFLETMDVPAYKIASFELVDLPLIQACARTGKPLIVSTGMSTIGEVDDAVRAARAADAVGLALLHCNSAYPAPPEEMRLATIPMLALAFQAPVGLSDHTLTDTAAVASVALGATILEKHFTLSREVPGPDSAFSLEPEEFRRLVGSVRSAERAVPGVRTGPSPKERASLQFRRSLWVAQDVPAGAPLTTENVRCLRPGHGLPPKHLPQVIGRRAARDLAHGEPVDWAMLA